MDWYKFLKSKAEDWPLVTPTMGQPDERKMERCQGCEKWYRDLDVTIIENVGPICANCQYHLTKELLSLKLSFNLNF